jgi:hypothetical protein
MRKIAVLLVFLILFLSVPIITKTYANPDLIASYSETNYDSSVNLKDLHPSDSAENSAYQQCFEATQTFIITSAKFYLRKAGSPTGNAYAVLYAMTGTYGTSGKPTGAALATSNPFDVSTLTTSNVLIEFTFSDADEQVADYYCIAFENPESGTINANDYTRVGRDGTSPNATGNVAYFTNGGWTAQSTSDACFYVYGTLVAEGTTLNCWGTVALTFSINSVRSWIFSREGTASETFSLNGLKGFQFYKLGNAEETFGVNSQHSFYLQKLGISILTFSIDSLRSWLFNIQCNAPLTYNILSYAYFTTGTILNLYGTAALTLAIASQRYWELSIQGNASLTFSIQGLTNIFIAGLLNLWGQATLLFTINGSASGLIPPLTAETAFAIGMLALVIAMCALGLVVMKRKQQ